MLIDEICNGIIKENKNIFSKLGKACLKNYYMAYNKQDIIDFINNVVVIGADPLIDKRKKFFERKLTINFPQVSKTILEKLYTLLPTFSSCTFSFKKFVIFFLISSYFFASLFSSRRKVSNFSS